MLRRWRGWYPLLVAVMLVVACSGNAATETVPAPSPTLAAVETPVAPSPSATPPGAASTQPPDLQGTPTPGASPTAAPQAPTTAESTATAASPAAFDPSAVTLTVEVVAEGFERPLFTTHAGDSSGRIYVVEQAGVVKLLDGEVVLDIVDRVGSGGNEQGLLGLAFHPRFAENGLIFVYYTDLEGNTVVSRFLAASDGSVDPASEQVILTQEQPASNHNGGMLAFGPDGYLYLGLGDGGRSYDAFGTAQDQSSLLGKLLRIDIDSEDGAYAIPDDNPFIAAEGARPEIWAYGLRNPWRFSFDRETGDLYVADVGQNAFEWLHFQRAGSAGGENYGWPVFEGDACLIEERCGEDGFTPPIAVYSQAEGGCAIIGGYVYRGQAFPALRGAYVYGDLCSGNIWAAARDSGGQWQTTLMLQIDAQISSFGEDEVGELYITDLSGGRVLQVLDGGSN